MPIIYRIQKGAPLSAQDLDGNFRELESRLDQLSQQQRHETDYTFSIIGSVLTIKDSQDNIVAESAIPVVRFTPKGAWAAQTLYALNDIVCSGAQVWCALKPHKSSDNFKADQAQWMLFADLSVSGDKS